MVAAVTWAVTIVPPFEMPRDVRGFLVAIEWNRGTPSMLWYNADEYDAAVAQFETVRDYGRAVFYYQEACGNIRQLKTGVCGINFGRT